MAEEPENLTIRLLQEIRSEQQRMNAEQQAIRAEISEMRTDITQRVDGNTLILNLVAGVVHDHEQRIERLEMPEG